VSYSVAKPFILKGHFSCEHGEKTELLTNALTVSVIAWENICLHC